MLKVCARQFFLNPCVPPVAENEAELDMAKKKFNMLQYPCVYSNLQKNQEFCEQNIQP